MKHLAHVFRAAKAHLEYGNEVGYNPKTSSFICYAVSKTCLAENVEDCAEAVALVNARLANRTAQEWKWPDSSMCSSFEELQAFRHAWLDALIIECETGERLPGFPEEDLKEVLT